MKIAYITTYQILGPQNGGGILCASRNLSLLKTIYGEDNVYVCAVSRNIDHLKYESKNTHVLFSSLKKLAVLKYALSGRTHFSKDTENAILKYITQSNVDKVFWDRSLMGFLPKRLPQHIKQVLYVTNVERDHIKPKRIVDLPQSLLLTLPVMKNELISIKNADTVMSLNERDASLLEKYYGRKSDFVLPITFDDSFVQGDYNATKQPNTKLHLLFVGALFRTNKIGVTWFINEVMPHIDAEFTVIGRDFEKLKKKLTRRNVNIVGTVDKVSDYYSNADVIVSPILFGFGMKVKTAEALMYGKPMFATDEALEGYDVDELENVYRCNTAEEFIVAINAFAEKSPYLSFDEKIRARFLEKYYTLNYMAVLGKILSR